MTAAPDTDAFPGTGTPLEHWQRSTALAGVPTVSLAELVPENSRLVVVAPHPDDEVLMCGGLLASLDDSRQRQVLLVSVTDGEASHRGSTRWSPQDLRQLRPRESRAALHELGLDTERLPWLRVGLPDSDVASRESELRDYLVLHLRPGDRVITTWRKDGHCDHEAVGRACAQTARQCQAVLLEAPVWTWHWASPNDSRLPWERARKLPLDARALASKHQAITAHHSQIVADGTTPAVLQAHALERLLQPFELVFT